MKIVLITGTNRGIDRQTVQELSDKGCQVYPGSRAAKTNGETVRDCKAGR